MCDRTLIFEPVIETPAKSACFVYANLSLLAGPMWNRQVETGLLWDEQRRAGTSGSRDVREASEAVGFLLLKHVEVG